MVGIVQASVDSRSRRLAKARIRFEYDGPVAMTQSGDGDDDFLRAAAKAPSHPPPNDEPDPRRLAQFVILGRLGQGGMGVVYRAKDEKLRRTVALKVLPRAFERDEERRRRFVREARSAAAITHPNIATVYEVGEADGLVFIAMELVEGETLRARITAGPLPARDAVRIARGIARGLARAHAKGVVHRDLKPENVMIDAEGEPKVLDFGLAKTDASSAGVEPGTADTASLLTEEGRLIGTPMYMSPEQVLGDRVDVRSDVFSLGVVLYEMLAGKRPFGGDTARHVLLAITQEDPRPLSEVARDVPAAVASVVARCLAKMRDDWYASGATIVDALDAAATCADAPSEVGAAIVPPTRPRMRRRFAMTAAGVVAVLAAAAWLTLRSGQPAAAPSPAPSTTAASHSVRAMTDWPPPRTSSPEAAASYAAGLQAYRDGIFTGAWRNFTRATQLDPHFAAASLRMFLTGFNEAGVDRLNTAIESRALLDARDARLLVLAQARASPSSDDLVAAARSLAAEMRDDPEVQMWAGVALEGGSHREEAAALFGLALQLDPKLAAAEAHLSMIAQSKNDVDGMLAAADRCLAISPSATTCLRRRADVHNLRGQCAELGEDAHRLVALEPDWDQGYAFLMTALASQAVPVDALRQLARQIEAVTKDPASPRRMALYDAARIGVYEGDFVTVDASLQGLEKEFASAHEEGSHWWTALRMYLYEEEGEGAKAAALADDYMRRRPAWLYDGELFARAYTLAVRRRHGHVSEAEARATREAWIAEDRRRLDPDQASSVWFFYYALSQTPGEAREALEVLPSYQPLPSASPGLEGFFGRTLLLGGDVDAALPRLRAGAAWCGYTPQSAAELGGIGWDIARWQVRHTLGLALEQKGDTQGACAEYARVLERWGKARPRSLTADEARKHATVLGCAK
jgi:serine/threonine-protein kinase